MLKKFGRKALSLLLVFVLVATTFFIFDPSILLPKSKAVVDVKKLVNTVEPTVKFYVPEAIYLNPVVGTGSKPYSFQYFIDSDENGTLRRSATQTTGTVYFSCSAACTSISISWENSSVTARTDTSSNQIVKQTITGGTTSVRDGSVKVTATYVVEGKTYSAYAYTYMYYPELDLLTGTASSYVYKASGNEPKLSAFSFITGVHKVGNKTVYDNTEERGVSNYYDQYNGSSDKGYYGISPLIPGWAHVWENGSLVPGSSGAIFKTADEGRIYDRDIIYGETTSSLPTKFHDGSGNGGVYFRERERAGGTNKTYGGISNSWGVLYVDTSRVSNYNQIPNLRGGFICHYYQRCGKRGELETFASDDSGITILNNVDFRNGDGHSYGMSDADRLSGAVTSTDKIYNMRATYKYRMDAAIGSSSTVTMNQDFGLKVYPVNKKSLREAYRAAIENGWQSATASKHGWSSSAQSQWTTAYNNFVTALATAGEVLGRPYATSSEVSSALSNLNNRVTVCNNIVNANFQGGENTDLIPHVTFYVPEAIYLTPAASNMNTFQYYVDRENAVNGTLRTGENTTGNVFFKCDEATKITSITCSGASVTLGATSSSTNTLSTTITKGTTNTAYSANGTGTLTWTVKYVVGNATYENKAYTTVYAPYTNAIASGYACRNGSKSEISVGGILWITGMHGYVNDKYNSGSDATGGMNYQPLLTTQIDQKNIGYDPKNKPDRYLSWNGSGDGYAGFYNKDQTSGSYTGKRSGYITVDTSRYSNYNGIPNLQYGFDYLGHRFGKSSRSQQMSLSVNKQNGTTYSTYSLNYTLNGNTVIEGGGYRDGSKNWKTYYHFNTSIPVNSTPVRINGAISLRDESRGVSTNNYLYFDTTVVNKAALRSYYNSCICNGRQASWYTTTTWNNYQNALNAAGTVLGNPLSDAAAISNAKTNLEAKEEALVRLTGTVKATHIRHTDFGADYNGNTGSAIIGTTTESKNYTYGDRVYGYYNEIPGFTKYSYTVKDASGTSLSHFQDSTYNNYYCVHNSNTSQVNWTFYYKPNTYSINYDPNGGTYNGTTGLTSSSVLFQSKYIVGKIGSATPANPTRPGCTFMGWKCSADGMVYQPGANINWEFLENVTFTAQWEYNSINLRFNENHDKLASNLLDPLVDGTISYDSTATITSTNDAGETVTTTKACNLKIEKLDDGTIRINGTLAGGYTFGFVPMDFEDGKQYVFSNIHISGSLTNGCMVIDPALSNGNNVSPRNQFDFGGSNSKTITVDSTYAGYRFWIWHNDGAGSYMTFNNYTFKPRIELKSDSTTVPTSSTEYNNIFADYIQYNTLIQELPTPTRTGYTFDGWYTQANGGTKVKVGDRLLYSDWDLNNTSQTLYAHWTINKYKLMYENEFDFDNFKFSMANPPVTNTNSPITINEHENSIQFTSQKRADGVTDDFTSTGQNYTSAETGYMTLVPGHTYEISYSYTVDKAAGLNCYIFAYTSTSSTEWSTKYGNDGTGTYYNVGASPSGATTGTQTGTYTVPAGRPYAKLRFGSTTEGVTVKFSDICVRDLTDPMNYRGKSGGDGKENSLNKKFDTVTYKTTQSPLATITRQGYTFNGWYESENTSNGNGYGTQFTTSTAMPARDVPLYAQWKLNDYSIVINLNADSTDKATIGSFTYSKANNNTSNGNISLSTATSSQQESAGNIATINVAYGTSFTLPIPSRTGYTFTGWTASATPAYASLTDNGNTSASAYRVGAGGVTLTAHWSRNSYPVKAYAYGDIYNSATFALGRGGTVQIASDAAGTSVSKNIAYRSTTTLKATASTGYAFVGWYTDSALTNLYSTSASITSESVLTAGRTYYAKFKVQSYTITVNPDNATKGTTISGWYSAAGTAASSQTIKTSTEITMVYGSTLKMTAPEKTGYTFKGWSRTSGSTGTLNSTTGDSTYLCGAGAATLTAQWQINQYTITLHALANKFDTNTYSENGLGGTVQIDSGAANNKSTHATYNYNTTYTIKAAAYTGYKFEGWYTNPSLSGTAVSTSTSYTTTLGASNITYYAKFSVQSYQITVNPNGATGGTNLSGWYSAPGTAASAINGVTSSRTITMVYGSTLKMTAPEKTGYTFNGWSRTSGSTGTLNSTTGDSTYLCGAGEATLTAQWTAKVYTITYIPNGGSVNPTSDTFTIESAINLPTPKREGYVFDGWMVTKAEGSWVKDTLYTGAKIDAGNYGNVTVTAQWSKIVNVYFYSGENKATVYTIPLTFKNGETTKQITAFEKGVDISGWKQEGWTTSTDANADVVGAKIAGGTSLNVDVNNGPFAYYAIYTQTQTLKYNSNATEDKTVKNIPSPTNGTAYYNSNGAQTNVTHNIPSTVPTRSGYTFVSWNTEPNGSGESHAAGGKFTNKHQTDTLYAIWNEIQYTITYSYNGSGTADKSINYTITSAITIENAPTYKDHMFVGWKVTEVAAETSWTSGTLYVAGAKVGTGKFGNVKLVAQWVDISKAQENYGKDEYVDATIDVVIGVDKDNKQIVTTVQKFDNSNGQYTEYVNAKKAYDDTMKKLTDLQEAAVSKTGEDLITYGEKIKEAQKSFQAAVDALAGISLKERTVISDYLNNFRIDDTPTGHKLSEMNLNHYSKDVLNEVLNTLTAGANLDKEGRKITEKLNGKSYQTIMNEYVAKIADLFKNQKSTVKESKPAFEVYESVASINNSNDASLKAMAGVTAVNYVHTKKGATYYCYVNTKNPVILVTVNDIAGNSRVCYPTKAKVLKAEKSLESKEGVTASYSMANIHVTGDTSYDNYINNKIELNNKTASIGSNLSYYQQKQVIKLTPEFVGNSNGTVTYEFAATDDALEANVANQAKLSGDTSYSSSARYSLIDPKKPDTVDNRKYTTNENTIKIVVDYHVAEEIKDETGNVTGYKKLDVTGDQVENDKWLNQYHLFRQSGGASNWELPKTGDTEYTVNDGTYNQTGRGSFTFTYELGALDIANGKINTTDVNEIIALFKNSANYDNAVSCNFQGTKYQEVASNGQKIIRNDGKGVGYLPWGNNWSFNYYPKSQSYTYVHLVDRWGNVADKVFYVGNQDIKAVSVATASADGSYTILEDGGSGIATLSLNAANVEILTDENSTFENNVYKTTGNVIRIKTGEANKSYTLSMKDKATNASTAALKSDENGIITLNVEDTAHESGVYTFTLNGMEINLYDNVENDKYIVKVYDGEAEEGEAAELRVVTTGEVGKVRFTDTDGNTITVAASEKNDDGTKTWSMTKSKPAGEYEYSISVKVGYEWIAENSKVKLTFTEKILDSGLIRSAEYDAESGLYKITIEGRATKIQFISEDGMTRTYTRYHDSVKSRKTYDEDGNEVNDTARTLDHEIWLVDAKIYSGQKYTVMGKFEAGWNREGTASLTAH